jgi:hypothetical protein
MGCFRDVTVGYMVYPMSQIYQVTMYTVSENLDCWTETQEDSSVRLLLPDDAQVA